MTPYRTSGATTWVSWNDATDVATWRLLGGSSMDDLQQLSDTSRAGFETAIHSDAASYLAVQALDASGKVLAASCPVATAASRQ